MQKAKIYVGMDAKIDGFPQDWKPITGFEVKYPSNEKSTAITDKNYIKGLAVKSDSVVVSFRYVDAFAMGVTQYIAVERALLNAELKFERAEPVEIKTNTRYIPVEEFSLMEENDLCDVNGLLGKTLSVQFDKENLDFFIDMMNTMNRESLVKATFATRNGDFVTLLCSK